MFGQGGGMGVNYSDPANQQYMRYGAYSSPGLTQSYGQYQNPGAYNPYAQNWGGTGHSSLYGNRSGVR